MPSDCPPPSDCRMPCDCRMPKRRFAGQNLQCLILVALLVCGTSAAAQDELDRNSHVVAESGFDFSGDWQILWDDAIDGKLATHLKQCEIRLEMRGRQLSGQFLGKVQGRQRDDQFTGHVHQVKSPLVVLSQEAEGYTCTYQIYFNQRASATPRGVWHDTNGACGEFTLKRIE